MTNRHRQQPLVMASVLLLGTLSGTGVSAQTTADAPQAQSRAGAPTQQQHQNRRGPKQFMLANGEGAVIKLWKPDLSTQPIESKQGSITIPSTGVDNYHAVVAVKDWGYLKEAVIRYAYMRGKPSGQSSTKLTAAQKTEFEIVPNPIPREHSHYASDQEWAFILRFKEKPIPNLPVVMETANGSRIEGISDEKGMVRLHIPDDFPNVIAGERDRRTAEFSLSAEYKSDGITYQTMLSAEYRVNQQHWQALSLGIAVTAFGMLAGGFLGHTKSGKGASA